MGILKKWIVASAIGLPALLDAGGRITLNLNGVWQFDKTADAFPPAAFTRSCPVPGLIHLAEPRIESYPALFPEPGAVTFRMEHDLTQRRYEPRYSWYRRKVFIPDSLAGREAVLTLLKSQFVTQVYVNGMDAGLSMSCFTPIDLPVTPFLKFGSENEIRVRVGERIWLPSAAAGGTDKEKVNYIPGIWDDVFLSFTGPFRIHRLLMLPSVRRGTATAKLFIRSFKPAQIFYGSPMWDSCMVDILIREKGSGSRVSSARHRISVKRDALTAVEVEIPVKTPHLWSPDDPFLYHAEAVLYADDGMNDRMTADFGMRDFEIRGRFFRLNDRRLLLRGSNITLHRFFEDPECRALPWDKNWVRRLLADIPEQVHWNAMRICVGIAPRFWYDIADSAGILLQNEWLYWQNHGWDDQIRAEYTDWVWSDGSHPSIAIWDAINENWDPFIGKMLIPELKQIDPTRPWDAGYMTSEHMAMDEMDEPHPYTAAGWRENFKSYMDDHPRALGDLHDWPREFSDIFKSQAAQLVNEYGWVWLWRNGSPSFLTVPNYRYYLGDFSDPVANRRFQSYWLQLETEWLRSERSLSGVLAFCYLTNNYGFTGDWFLDPVRDLKAGPALAWFRHAFAPAAVFIDLEDGRYMKHVAPCLPGSMIRFNLVGVNDFPHEVDGKVVLKILDQAGGIVSSKKEIIRIPAFGKTVLPESVRLPGKSGGYLMISEFRPVSDTGAEAVISRRYLKVGECPEYRFFDWIPDPVR